MSITLVVDHETAQALHGRVHAHPLQRAIESAGGALFPMPTYAPDEPGARTFIIESPAESALAERLQRMPGVEACYLKPDDAPP